MANYEQYPHIFNVKDLVRGDSNIFENRSTEVVRFKQPMKSRPNLIDFKITAASQMCLITCAEEIFERPIVSYVSKGAISETKIEKYEVQNINPYIIVVEDRTRVNIYNMIQKEQHHSLKIEDCKFKDYLIIIFRILAVCGTCQRKP